jgi:hypothetical protein
MKALAVASCLVLISSPAFAQTARSLATNSPDLADDHAVSDTHHSGDANAQGERLVCRNVQAQSYSRMGTHRVCHTEQQWRAIDQQAGE